jgi:hypothetical protein
MAFILTPKTSFTAPVTLHVPADGGKKQKLGFSVQFKLLEAEEVRDLMDRVQASSAQKALLLKQRQEQPELALEPMPAPQLSDRDIIEEVLIGFGADLQGPDRQPLPFTPDNLDELLKVHGMEAAIVQSFFEHHFKAPEKN